MRELLIAFVMAAVVAVLALSGGRGDRRPRRPSPDGGPVYVESDFKRLLPEPWNAASSLLFPAIVAYWLVRLRGRYRRYTFLTACLPILAIGSLGGMVYHTFRAHRVWLVMDWLPIVLLLLAVSIWMWRRLLRRGWWVWVIVPPILAAPQIAFRSGIPVHLAILVAYGSMGALTLPPAVVMLWRTRGTAWGWTAAALVLFAGALASRQVDAAAVADSGVRAALTRWLPMGSHWLWHVFGAAATFCLSMYVYRLTDRLRPASEAPEPPA